MPFMDEKVAYTKIAEAIFITLDDGRCIALDQYEETRQLITDNYELLRKLAKNVEYQYILNMNYTRFAF